MGGKGERIAQCSQARITTTKAIPMQVDGEPCLLAPSTIEITFHSQVCFSFKLEQERTGRSVEFCIFMHNLCNYNRPNLLFSLLLIFSSAFYIFKFFVTVSRFDYGYHYYKGRPQ